MKKKYIQPMLLSLQLVLLFVGHYTPMPLGGIIELCSLIVLVIMFNLPRKYTYDTRAN